MSKVILVDEESNPDIFQDDEYRFAEYKAVEPLSKNATEAEKLKRTEEIYEREVSAMWKPYMVLREVCGVDLWDQPDVPENTTLVPQVTRSSGVAKIYDIDTENPKQLSGLGDSAIPFKIRVMVLCVRSLEKFSNVLLRLSRTIWPLTLLRKLGWKVLEYKIGLSDRINSKLYLPAVKALEQAFCVSGDLHVFKKNEPIPDEVKDQIISGHLKCGGCEVQNGIFKRQDCVEK